MTERTKSQIGRSSRRKGQESERALAAELSALLGIEIKRRVRNHANDSDLVGLPGWSAEAKCCAKPAMAAWWAQTVGQAGPGELPVLFYRLPRKPWRAVVSLAAFGMGEVFADVAYTAEVSLEGFAMLYREDQAVGMKIEQQIKDSAMRAGVRVQ